MTPVRLAMGLIVGCVAISPVPARAQEALKAPDARRLTLDFKATPFRQALEQIFVPGGLKVKLEADVPTLPVTLALKGVDEGTAFRLLFRQAKKQEQDLQFEPIDDGYRIFLGKPAQEEQANPYPLTPQPKLPKPFAPPTPDFPAVQNREVEPLIADLLQRTENGDTLLPAPIGADPEDGFALDDGFSNTLGAGFGSGYGGNGYGGFGFDGPGYGSYGNYGGYGYNGNGFGGGFGSLNGLRGLRNVDPYSSPLGGGLAVRDQISQRLYERKKKPNPYFYDHRPQWILEHRTVYWPNPRRSHRGGGGGSSPKNGTSGPIGGGYLPR